MELKTEDINVHLLATSDETQATGIELSHRSSAITVISDKAPTKPENIRLALLKLVVKLLDKKHPPDSTPCFFPFDEVTTVSPNSIHKGTIRRLVWHFKEKCWNYYIKVDNKNISKRYYDTDLQRICEPTQVFSIDTTPGLSHVNLPSTISDNEPIQICINGKPVLELITFIEEAFTELEYYYRTSEGEVDSPEEPIGVDPGSYGLPLVRHLNEGKLLGPIENLLVVEDDDPDKGLKVIFDCDCGNEGCWPLCIRIEENSDHITWQHFHQIHRPEWHYPIGPYTFKKSEYFNRLRQK